MKLLRLILCATILGCYFPTDIYAKFGLGTQFTDVIMEGLELGQTYNIRELRGMPYTVKNVGDSDLEIQIAVTIPNEKNLKDGYEPIPDPNWIRLSPERHRIPARGMAFSDVIISIPNDPEFKGRHFQAFIWAHTVETGILGTGVQSRIRFSVGTGPEGLKEEKRRKQMVDLNFNIWPSSLYVIRAKAGGKYNIKSNENKSLKITNRSDKPLELVLKSVPWGKQKATLPEGYKPAEKPEWLKFKPKRVKIKPFRVKEVKLSLEIPEEKRAINWRLKYMLVFP